MSSCKSCGARITWLETAGAGRPVEEQPEGGRAIVSDAGESFPYLAELIDSRKENEHA